MTDREKAIVMAHTGICMLTGNKFQIFHKYIENIMGRPIMTHEIGWLADAIKEKSKADFMALCADESSSEKSNRCEDAIRREDALKVINKYGTDILRIEAIKALPPVSTEKTGYWIDTGSGQKCSKCHEIQYGYDNHRLYCANCGSRNEVRK